MSEIPPEIEMVSKIDAARRQLRCAIRLFFEDGDAVSVFTLGSAAHDILRALLSRSDRQSAIKDWPDLTKEQRADLNEEQNFFKHASSDPKKTLPFHTGLVPILLADCADMYARATGRALREGRAIMLWYAWMHPGDLSGGAENDQLRSLIDSAGGVPMPKRYCLELLARPDAWPDAE
jgi:hypothetical protein